MLLYSVALLALLASAQGRAVNISNTWVLPEEGFPVFYRYFRDRISWYEADAVCQFHHANLVTVDTTAQYDAVRAYLKELDISSAVWVGLIRSNPDGDFTWTDYRGLSGEGYWSSAPDTRASPLCAAADPAADYRWEARACGGPTVASFICELPVPQWALGNEGCMVRELPALTILYLPESAAVQLTADCGLAGVKRVQCTGNVKRENLLKDLSCADEEEPSTTASVISSGNTWPATTDAIFVDQETTTETATEENSTTEHEDDINQTSTILPLSTTHNTNTVTEYKILTKPIPISKFNRINNNLDKNIDLNLLNTNNLQSNHIPKIANTDNYLANEQQDKIEDEKYIQHKMLHEEIARLGNLDNIFTQPTDHFVPPLVMAKAKISNDMTVLSLQEKHAQQLAEQHLAKQINEHRQNDHIYDSDITRPTTEEPKAVTIDKIIFIQATKSNKKDKTKASMPKKYSEKAFDSKSKVQKIVEMKSIAIDRITEPSITTETVTKHIEMNSLPLVGRLDNDEDSLNLTVFLNESPERHEENVFYNYSGDVSRLEVVKSNTLKNETDIKLLDLEATEQTKHEIPSKDFEEKIQNITLNDEVVNITIISNGYTTASPVVIEITTKTPVSPENISVNASPSIIKDDKMITATSKNNEETTKISFNVEPVLNISVDSSLISNLQNDTISEVSFIEGEPTKLPTIASTNVTPNDNTTFIIGNIVVKDNTPKETTTTASSHITHGDGNVNANTEAHEDYGTNSNSSDSLDDFNSPLLSGANEPVRRPNRSRRPQPPPNRNKFNPFRILG